MTLTSRAVLGSLVMAMMGQRGRYFDNSNAVLSGEQNSR